MKVTLLVTCGTSLLTNAARDASQRGGTRLSESLYKRLIEINSEYDLSKLSRLEPGSIEDNEIKEKHTHHGNELFEVLKGYLNEGKSKVSAEVNTIDLLREKRLTKDDVSKIFLYHSDTGSGFLCARIIEEYLKEEEGYNVERVEVKGFGTEKTLKEFEEGMIDLMSKIVSVVKKRKETDEKVYVLATAGFKPESTAAVIAALLAKADGIYYVYEANRILVSIPGIPLAIDEKYIQHIKRIFKPDYRDEPIDALLGSGVDSQIIDMLEEKGLVERKGEWRNKLALRAWVKELIQKNN